MKDKIMFRPAHLLTEEELQKRRAINKAACQRYRDANRLKIRTRYRVRYSKYYALNKAKILARNRASRLRRLDKCKEELRIYYQANRAKLLAYAREYRRKNAAILLEKRRLYYLTHTEQVLDASKARYEANREAIKAKQHAYNATHKEAALAYERAYVAAHPEQIRARNARRRARQANAPVNDFTAEQWRDMQAHYDHRCVYCGKRAKGHLTQDHITPLCEGGSHTLSNIVPACRSCNCKKYTGPPLTPVQPMLL